MFMWLAGENFFRQFSSTGYYPFIHTKSLPVHTIYFTYPPKSKVFRLVSGLMHIGCAERIFGVESVFSAESCN